MTVNSGGYMKLKKLKLDNFAKFSNFECEFDGKITKLIGMNGSGKTTVGLTSIWAGFRGIALNSTNGQLIGERWRFIGNEKKNAGIEITLVDEKQNAEIIIRNKITDKTNSIDFVAPEGYKVSEDWINNLLSVSFLSAKNFTQMSSKRQAIELGIDTSKYDQEIKKLKEEYTYINRDIRNLGYIQNQESPEPVEPVSISELVKKKDEIAKANDIESQKMWVKKEAEKKIISLKDQLEQIEKEIKQATSYYESLENPKELIDDSTIVEQINNAEIINKKASFYQQYSERYNKYKELKESLDDNKQKQNDKDQERLEYIKSFKTGLDDLNINENGELLLSGKPIKEPYFSKGELEIIVTKLYSMTNPVLKIRFIDDFELLDENNQKKIIDWLLERDYQIITAEVGEQKPEKNVIVLRECQQVKDSNVSSILE